MSNINDIELLELVESYIEANCLYEPNWVADEQELSDRFDETIDECYSDEIKLKYENGLDLPMLREEFNNFSDHLCKGGLLHSEQYSNYCYVGKFES